MVFGGAGILAAITPFTTTTNNKPLQPHCHYKHKQPDWGRGSGGVGFPPDWGRGSGRLGLGLHRTGTGVLEDWVRDSGGLGLGFHRTGAGFATGMGLGFWVVSGIGRPVVMIRKRMKEER
ncbi:hypothetical protein MRB53_014110 [Persea americana]|uniref:Uncharacterized protein n=1 Tax=Persea americana TaxID=3435 RepID=A0ACC2KAE4_PERAE|nr:hypothetical protein MRB53_014110 [Persea americana]